MPNDLPDQRRALYAIFPALVVRYLACPLCCGPRARHHLNRIIVHMNDVHKCTREEIADWLEQCQD